MHCGNLTAFLPSLNSGMGQKKTLKNNNFWQLYQQNPCWRICCVEVARAPVPPPSPPTPTLLKIQLYFSSLASYVSAMVPVKSPREYYVQQEVIVLFCETVERWANVLNSSIIKRYWLQLEFKQHIQIRGFSDGSFSQGPEAGLPHAGHDRWLWTRADVYNSQISHCLVSVTPQ